MKHYVRTVTLKLSRWFPTRHRTSVFVLGNQKSGTTAIAALLAECTGESVALDLRQIARPAMAADFAIGTLSLGRILRECRGAWRNRIVKEPTLTFYGPELMERFPMARYILVVRDPRDNIRSILNRLSLPGNHRELSAEQVAKLSVAWREVVENRRLGFAEQPYIESLARRWVRAWTLFSPCRDRVVVVKYEDFLADKTGVIRSLATSVGLQPKVDITEKTDTQYQRKGDRSVSWQTFFGAENLALIDEVCAGPMRDLGYKAGQLQAVPI